MKTKNRIRLGLLMNMIITMQLLLKTSIIKSQNLLLTATTIMSTMKAIIMKIISIATRLNLLLPRLSIIPNIILKLLNIILSTTCKSMLKFKKLWKILSYSVLKRKVRDQFTPQSRKLTQLTALLRRKNPRVSLNHKLSKMPPRLKMVETLRRELLAA